MNNNNKQNNSPASLPVNPYAGDDKEILPSKNDPVAIARVISKSDYLKGNSLGDRVSLEPKKAKWLESHRVVIREVASVLPSAIRAAGGVDKYLKQNPKQDLLDSRIREKLLPIPGIPTGAAAKKPWDYEEV